MIYGFWFVIKLSSCLGEALVLITSICSESRREDCLLSDIIPLGLMR
jgi:hypothetical protein